MIDPTTSPPLDFDAIERFAKAGVYAPAGRMLLALVARLREAERDRDTGRVALAKINAVRNGIIGAQTLDWSEHIYPLVSALEEAGCVGEPYPKARANVGTLIERCKAAERERDEARASLPRCSCDAFCDDPCPVHARENALQNEVLALKSERDALRAWIATLPHATYCATRSGRVDWTKCELRTCELRWLMTACSICGNTIVTGEQFRASGFRMGDPVAHERCVVALAGEKAATAPPPLDLDAIERADTTSTVVTRALVARVREAERERDEARASLPRCSCDAFCDDPCPVHARENALQNEVLALKSERDRIADHATERAFSATLRYADAIAESMAGEGERDGTNHGDAGEIARDFVVLLRERITASCDGSRDHAISLGLGDVERLIEERDALREWIATIPHASSCAAWRSVVECLGPRMPASPCDCMLAEVPR